jgi:hypothetical protein
VPGGLRTSRVELRLGVADYVAFTAIAAVGLGYLLRYIT